jgi:hypothetical protein
MKSLLPTQLLEVNYISYFFYISTDLARTELHHPTARKAPPTFHGGIPWKWSDAVTDIARHRSLLGCRQLSFPDLGFLLHWTAGGLDPEIPATSVFLGRPPPRFGSTNSSRAIQVKWIGRAHSHHKSTLTLPWDRRPLFKKLLCQYLNLDHLPMACPQMEWPKSVALR